MSLFKLRADGRSSAGVAFNSGPLMNGRVDGVGFSVCIRVGAGRAAGGAVLFDLIVGGAVLDMALMPTREGVVVPEMFNDQ